MEDQLDTITMPAPVEYVVQNSVVKSFDFATMKDDVKAILAGDEARKWLGEPLSDDTLDILAKGAYGFRAFGVIDQSGGAEKCVGFIYFSPAPFEELATVIHGVSPDAGRAVTATFVKGSDAPRGVMSRAMEDACNAVVNGRADMCVTAFVAEDNVASRRFLEKNGFVDVGVSTVEDHEKDRVYVRKN